MSVMAKNIMPVNNHGLSTMCSQCSSMAHFACINHCNVVFCGKCSVKHRTEVIKQMDDLTQQLQRCKIEPVATHDEIDNNFLRASKQTIQRTRDTVNNLIAEIQQREDTIIKEIENGLEMRRKEREKRTHSALLTSEQAVEYTHMLHDCLKRDKLPDAEEMTSIQRRLNARSALGQSASEAKHPIVELGKFDPVKLLPLRFAPRAESSQHINKNSNSVTVTVRLGKTEKFESPLQSTFSVGKHPTAISLNDRYLETFFCRRTPGNSLILLSTTAIDVVNRGSGIEMSVRLSKILGTVKDKILAGTWCEYSQRLILVGNHQMYFYDLQGKEHAKIYQCEPAHGDPGNTPRFLACTYDGSIFYAYTCGSEAYTIEKHAYPDLSLKDDAGCADTKSLFGSKQTANINGRVAAMCVTHNRIAVIYRKFESDKKFKHFLCLLDQNFTRFNGDDIPLDFEIKWITAIASFGDDSQYLLCDPRGQQLLLYRLSDKILARRFRIGAINACCLTDGKLVLWLQKQYASSPTGKLHFITAPHLERTANVAKSLPLLADAQHLEGSTNVTKSLSLLTEK